MDPKLLIEVAHALGSAAMLCAFTPWDRVDDKAHQSGSNRCGSNPARSLRFPFGRAMTEAPNLALFLRARLMRQSTLLPCLPINYQYGSREHQGQLQDEQKPPPDTSPDNVEFSGPVLEHH